MKKCLLLSSFLIISFKGFAQISFEKGYFIDNSGQTFDCFIRNVDWKDNPVDFEYKLSKEGKPKRTSLIYIKEFGIGTSVKFVRATVNIDKSSEDLNRMGKDRNPIFEKENVFLEVLTIGYASLYQYRNGGLKRFFYSIDANQIEPLVFKYYLIDKDKKGTNNRFKQQLWNELSCAGIKKEQLEKLTYTKKSLTNYFIKFNECSGQQFKVFGTKSKYDIFNFTVRPRINRSSLVVSNFFGGSKYADFGSKTGLGFGIETEFVLPFQKNKWGLIIEPTYHMGFKETKTTDINDGSGANSIANLSYSSIELPVGLRHYFFLKEKSKLFINASYVYDINSETTLIIQRTDNPTITTLTGKSSTNWAFGIGLKVDRFSLEARYFTNRDIISDFFAWDSQYNAFSMILGYTVF